MVQEPTNDETWPYDVTEVGSEPQGMPQDAAGGARTDDNPDGGYSEGVGDSIAPDALLEPLLIAMWQDAREYASAAGDHLPPDTEDAHHGFIHGYLHGFTVADEVFAIHSDPACRNYDVLLTNGDNHAHGVVFTNGSGAVIASLGEQFPQRVWERAGWTVTRDETD